MAVYTHISDDALQQFIAAYDIGALLSFKGIAEGVENTNYMVHTEGGTFILTLYEKRVREEDLPFFLTLMEHLAGAGLSCPLPVHDRQGEVLREISGRPAALITFLEGVSVNRPGTQHCAALGASLAEFHLAGAGFDLSRANSLSVKGWRDLYQSCGGAIDTITGGLTELIENELGFLETRWPSDLPRGIIHADLFPDNVFFLKDQVSGIIDFYFACEDMLSYDLAICLNAWCFESDASFNITKSQLLLGRYSQKRALTGAEFDALPLLARGAALRFLLTRVYDWLHTDEGVMVNRHDPMVFVRKLRFHQRVESAREYGIDAPR